MAERTLEELIASLSPTGLDIYKKQLRGRTGAINDTAYSRLSKIPELEDITGSQRLNFTSRETQQTQQPQRQSNIPLWQKPLKFIESVEKGAGTLLSAPFTPSVKGTEGMSWWEREKAEYEKWDAPQVGLGFNLPKWMGGEEATLGVKGALEMTPWLATTIATAGLGAAGAIGARTGIGALTKGAQIGTKALKPIIATESAIAKAPFKIAGKIASPIVKPVGRMLEPVIENVMAQAGKWGLPTTEMLNHAYIPSNLRKFAQWAEDKPVLRQVIQALGGEAAFVKLDSDLPIDIVRRATVNRARLKSIGNNLESGIMPRITRYGNPKEVLGITDDALVTTAVSKSGKASYLNDVLENMDDYVFTTPAAEAYMKDYKDILNAVNALRIENGLQPTNKVHRIVEGIITQDGRVVKSKYGSDPSLSRIYDTQEAAANAHKALDEKLLYGNNPNEIMSYTIDRTVDQIARKRYADAIKGLGKKPIEKFAETYPEKAEAISALTSKLVSAKNTLDIVQKVLTYKATSIPGATLTKIARDLPEFAGKLSVPFEVTPAGVSKITSNLIRDLKVALKTDPEELKRAVNVISEVNATWRGQTKISITDVEDAIKNLNLHAADESRIITNAYKETIKQNRKLFQNFLKENRAELEGIIDSTKLSLQPVKKDRSKFLKAYAGREKLPHKAGEVTERPFNRIPEFRGKFFPDDIVTYMEKTYSDIGNQWIKKMGSVSAISRNLTAVLDDSAPFIQGLFLLGRNPVMWARTTARQLEFLIKPEIFTKYMAKPEIQALHQEMVKYGSTIGRFEMFEALPQIERLLGKLPKGEVAQKAVQQTYGRAEAAFTGFGQLARDNMWKALRKPGMTDAELQELARTLDLMTGNISTMAMGIGATQRDIESAFVFFSPRFTRASLAFVGDVFKGGLAGAEARKSIAGLMAGGTAMYYGVAKALGQEPNLDPSSGRFMTIQVGDTRVGVGGILYSLARLAGNLSTVDSPMDLLKPDRFDNPFLKFMYSKSAPLTGLLTGAIEQTDYMGQPFESAEDWGRFIGEKILPFSVQPLLEQETPTPASFLPQFFGARQFPISTYDKRQEERDKVALEKYRTQYDVLNKMEQYKVNQAEEVKKLSEQLETEGRITPESIMWDRWNEESTSIDDKYKKAVDLASREFRETGNGVAFRDKIDMANAIKRDDYGSRAIKPEYAGIMEYLNAPKSPDQQMNMHPMDLARDEYFKMMYSPDMYDQYGNYLFDKAEQKEKLFIQQHGQRALDYVNEFTGTKRQDTPEMEMLRQAREMLAPYWGIADEIWNLYPPQLKEKSIEITNIERTDPRKAKIMLRLYPQILRARELIARYRKQMVDRNPMLKQVRGLFYG